MIRIHTLTRPPDVSSPDVYFAAAYGRAAIASDDGDWVLLEEFDGAWQLPLIVRTSAGDVVDGASPYGYSGVFASSHLSDGDVERAWESTLGALRDIGLVSIFLRHSPLVPQAKSHARQRLIVSGHRTMLVDIASVEGAWDGMQGRCRTAVRKATKNGYTGAMRVASPVDFCTSSPFRSLYEQTMLRRDATFMYHFEDEYYLRLAGGLGDSLLLGEVSGPDGAVVSSALFMKHGDLLHYHLSGSTPDGAKMGANNLLLWIAIQYAATIGVMRLHLGGGLRAEDSLFAFKRSFGGQELPFRATGIVVDDVEYSAQTSLRAKLLGTSDERLEASSFFPAYRAGAA